MSQVCPICNGEGKKMVLGVHKLSGLPKMVTEWCICMKARFVSDNKSYKLLKRLPSPDRYMPFDEMDSQLKFYPNNLAGSPNLLIRSHPEELFFLNLKSLIMQHRFNDPASTFLCCGSIDILKDFYVQQGDGSSPQLSDVNNYDLLVFSADNNEKNDQLKTCISQVVYNRICIRKPTWIYINRPTLTNCIYEYSPDLQEYIDRDPKDGGYLKISLELERETSSANKSSDNFSSRESTPDDPETPEPSKRAHRGTINKQVFKS